MAADARPWPSVHPQPAHGVQVHCASLYGWLEALPVPGYTPMTLRVSPAAIRACNWACVYTALVSLLYLLAEGWYSNPCTWPWSVPLAIRSMLPALACDCSVVQSVWAEELPTVAAVSVSVCPTAGAVPVSKHTLYAAMSVA